MSEDTSRDKSVLEQFPQPGQLVPAPADSGWWFTVAAYAVCILAIAFAPDISGSAARRVIAAALLMAGSFALVWGARWTIFRCHHLRTRWEKGRLYDRVYDVAAEGHRQLDVSQSLVRRFLSAMPSHTEITVSVLGGEVFLEFPKKGKRSLPAVGRALSLLDCENGIVLGTFEVTHSDGNVCQAKSAGKLDPVFRGYALSTNARFLPTHMALFALPDADEDESDE